MVSYEDPPRRMSDSREMGNKIMKLFQFYKDGAPSLGIRTGEGWIDAAAESRRRGIPAPQTMVDCIRGGEEALAALRALSHGAEILREEPRLAPAVTGGEKILCIGLNYRKHIEETNDVLPSYTVVFSKLGNALAASGEEIRLDPAYSRYDYEAELVLVIGKAGAWIPEEEAMDHVFGYTCGNDVSNRETQLERGSQWLLGKSMDGFGPVGPCVVTAEELDPDHTGIRSRVNGELRQDSDTCHMIFSCRKIISYISEHMTLKPGDIIFTGTPEGVALGQNGEKQWLRPGDLCSVEIDGIGELVNRFV